MKLSPYQVIGYPKCGHFNS